MQNTEIKMLQVPFKSIRTQDHYFLSNWCDLLLSNSYLTLATQTLCFSVLAHLRRLQA